MIFRGGADPCLSIFADVWPRYFDFPRKAQVLEVGCAEADWITPMKSVRPDLSIVGIDVRPVKRPSKEAKAVIVGDVLSHDFGPDAFDAVVFISSLEHIGLGRYGDPLDPDGDIHALQRSQTWLKPGGLVYFDVPHRETYIVKPAWREYDDAALASRLLPGWTERVRAYATVDHPDSPYVALVLEKCREAA